MPAPIPRAPTARDDARPAAPADPGTAADPPHDHDRDDPTAERPPSKTRRKQQMHALQALGERLVGLDDTTLSKLGLPERLHDAIVEARGTRTHEGRRRQMQFIGRLMRDVEPDEIERTLDAGGARHRGAVAAMHAAERWRDGLMDGSRSLPAFIERYPAAAASAAGPGAGLAALLKQARGERDARRPPRQQRNLYRELHRIIADQENRDDGHP